MSSDGDGERVRSDAPRLDPTASRSDGAAERAWPSDVHVLQIDGREVILVGTAHISRESADLVREVIEKERPDCVCVELDAQRYAALSEPRRWEQLDLKAVIRNRQLAPLLANLLLASYQKKLGGALGVLPGTELLTATRTADALGIPVALCDRDVRVTLRRVWASLGFWNKSKLLATLLAGVIEQPELDEEELRRIREQDVLSELMRELGQALPGLLETLIYERDLYLAHKILAAGGDRLVAVVGAGHVEGIRRALEERREADIEAINQVPPVGRVWKAIGWGVPALILGALAWIGFTKGAAVAGENLWFWVLANGVPATLGAVIALAHPVVMASAFFVAPVTSLIPVIGAGYVLSFLQAWLKPPLVSEFDSLADDFATLRRWWRSRLLRIFLVFVLTTLGSLIGTWVGGARIAKTLF